MSSKCLNNLWDLIKDVPSLDGKEHNGLEEVDFSLPIEDFAYQNYLKHKEVVKRIDTCICNPSKAFDILKEKNIRKHHLSCVDNNALCIHYISHKRVVALTIPGVTYS